MKCFVETSKKATGMDGEMNYKEYYNSSLQKGLEFQDFVAIALLKEIGIPLTSLSSKKFQFSVGENLQGIEIKFDDKFFDTGNIYIEVKEKSNPINLNYVDSGIYRNDNTWLYLIGNYSTMFIFGKKHLQLMYESQKYREVENSTKTSIGFLVPVSDATKYSLKKINL